MASSPAASTSSALSAWSAMARSIEAASAAAAKSLTRRSPDQGEFCQFDLDRARRGPFADNQIELEILHRGVQHFLDRGAQAMDFVDEQHVALFEIGQEGCEIAGLGDHGAGSGAKADAEFGRDDLR